MTKKEFKILKSQSATSSWGGRRKLPNAFTERGVAMLSGILHSERAIKVNIQLVFSYLDELLKKDKNPEPIKRVGFKRNDER